MTTLKKRDFSKAAAKKGFIENRRGDHIYYHFTDINGKILEQIHTKMSHGDKSGDLSDNLVNLMYKQLKFEKKEDFIHYVECTFSEKDYRNTLRKKQYKYV